MPLDIPWPFPDQLYGNSLKSYFWRCGSNLTLFAVGCLSKLWIQGLNSTNIHNYDSWVEVVENRPNGRPLLTVCNHTCNVDDPLLFGLLPIRLAFHPRLLRWGLGASNICFTRSSHGAFCSFGKVIPVHRGDGVYQRGVDMMLERLEEGDWGHVFPEGKVNLTQEWIRLKWGVGRLVAECKFPPLVLPFWHEGLSDVMPNKKPYIPRVGQKITVVFGDVIDTRELLEKLTSTHQTAESLRKAVTDFLQDELAVLRDKTRALHFGESYESSAQNINKSNSKESLKIMEQLTVTAGNFNESNYEERRRLSEENTAHNFNESNSENNGKKNENIDSENREKCNKKNQ